VMKVAVSGLRIFMCLLQVEDECCDVKVVFYEWECYGIGLGCWGLEWRMSLR